MLLADIRHKTTLKSLEKHNITEDKLNEFNTIDELRIYISRCSRRLWQRKNKDYFKNRYEKNKIKNNNDII